MQWYDIERVEIEKTNNKVMPVRMKMIRDNKSVVTSGGYSVAGAAVTLFSTAGLGRHLPRDLARMLKKKLDCLLDESWMSELLTGLSIPVIM